MTREESRLTFITRLHQKLDQGAAEHGEKSFDLPSDKLVEELQAEALDLAGWGWILWDRLERLRVAALALESERVAPETLPAPAGNWDEETQPQKFVV